MYLVSKDKNSIINMSQITVVYLGADNCTIKADYQNGKGCQVGRYNSEAEAKTAMDIVANSMDQVEVCFMPQDSEVNARLNLEEQKQHHISGKKTKGHGGS
ncbi:MAG: hypothetical protein NC393_08200 [Clostridium sp.]|nr:hypothetical protein [Clostridium sp.]MCM1209096.1 hypothetical protein [Ruminococcus sp.]